MDEVRHQEPFLDAAVSASARLVEHLAQMPPAASTVHDDGILE